MTDHTPITDDLLDRAAEAVRNEDIDDETVDRMTDRVWNRLQSDLGLGGHTLAGCDDYRAEIPALLAGDLSPQRALLVEDHTRECLPCRRALLEARNGVAAAPARSSAVSTGRWMRHLRLAAAAVVAIGIGVGAWNMTANLLADRGLTASVASVDGSLQYVADDRATDLAAGDGLRAHQSLRTPFGSTAFVRLDDGSTVEMAERSQVSLSASRRGTTINLERGSIIVHASDQHGGRLYVATDDCLVAVKGTIFSVNSGLRGSRVSVVEGEVEVRSGGRRDLLHPGQQMTTDDSLAPVPVESDIAWSRDADQHRALLHELMKLQQDMVAAADSAPARTSTRLLDLAPADTVVYAALPNLVRGLDEARAVFTSRLAENATLNDWWQREVVSRGLATEIDDMLDRLQPLGRTLGDEIAVMLPASALDNGGSPLVLAQLTDPDGFRSLLDQELARIDAAQDGGPMPVVVSSPQEAPDGAPAIIWITGDLLAVASNGGVLEALAARLDGDRPFLGTELHHRLAAVYAGGASWVVGADLGEMLDRNTTAADDRNLLSELGLMDASILILEHHREGDGSATSAELAFDGPRHGIAAWLAEPAPMGSLDFVSPQASVAVSAVTRDAADMLDDVLNTFARVNPEGLADFQRATNDLGLDLRRDLAASLGGEATFAIDGPVLPEPWWKLVIEVYDPVTLQASIERLIDVANRELVAAGEAPLELSEVAIAGQPGWRLVHPTTGYDIVWTTMDGYLVVGPGVEPVVQAIQTHAGSLSLPRSGVFTELLPADTSSDCSAVIYRNLGRLTMGLEGAAAGALPADAMELLRQSAEPSLFCVHGRSDRITVSGRGGSLFNSAPLLGIADLFGTLEGDHADDEAHGEAHVRVSSAG